MTRSLLSFFLFVGLLLTTSSCEQKKEDTGLGESIEPYEIQKAQDEILRKLDPYKIQQGQMVHKVQSQELITSQGPMKSLSKESRTEIVLVENLPDVRLLTAITQEVEFQDKDNFVYEYKNVMALPQKEQPITQENLKKVSRELGLHSIVQQKSEQEAPTVEGISFHNLKVSSVVIVPPQNVKDHENCRGLSPCEIKGDQIVYDIAFHMSDGEKQVHKVEWLFSDQVPFFAGILKQCATTLVTVEDLRVLVKQCNEVVDFKE